jgi:hypothetical protein
MRRSKGHSQNLIPPVQEDFIRSTGPKKRHIMQQSDYLLRQIQQMTEALVSLIRQLLGLKNPAAEEEAWEATNEMLHEHLGINLDDILEIPSQNIVNTLLQQKSIDPSNLDLFSEVLILNARIYKNRPQQSNLLNAAREILIWSDQHSNTFSLRRQQLLDQIEKLEE